MPIAIAPLKSVKEKHTIELDMEKVANAVQCYQAQAHFFEMKRLEK